ncbi:hypothetical protein [Streptomyces sp. NPDC088794]|uniref:hypothetical protein n=1 Tax=Streptomyces sp. NPDC088794 TaxID=3365902 RepID=UPI0038225BD8
MDLQSAIAGFPDVTPLEGLPHAWQWSLNPVLRYAGVLTADGTRLLQMNTRGKYSEELTRAVLSFAQSHEGELLQEGRFLGVVGGFGVAGRGFDAVAVADPEVAQLHKVRDPALTPVTYAVFLPTPVNSRAPRPQEKILLQEIPKLENEPGGFVEFENRHGKVWRAEWDNGWFLGEESGAAARPVALAELLPFVSARLRE